MLSVQSCMCVWRCVCVWCCALPCSACADASCSTAATTLACLCCQNCIRASHRRHVQPCERLIMSDHSSRLVCCPALLCRLRGSPWAAPWVCDIPSRSLIGECYVRSLLTQSTPCGALCWPSMIFLQQGWGEVLVWLATAWPRCCVCSLWYRQYGTLCAAVHWRTVTELHCAFR